VLAVAAVALASVGKPGVAHTRPSPSRYPTTKPPLTRISSYIARRFGAVTQETPQAGREIRVIVAPLKIGDDAAMLLSREIAREIERELEYPGQIKVTVIRESRAVEFAK